MKKNILAVSKYFVVTVLMVLISLSAVNTVNAEENKPAIERKVYADIQLSNDELIRLAEKGQLVNNAHTKTTITNGKGVSVIRVDKVLSEELINGEVVRQGNMTLQQVRFSKGFIDSVLENENVVNLGAITPAGYLGDDWTDGSYTVTINMVIYWDTKKIDGINHDRITSISYTPTLLDNRFSMTRIDAYVGYVGSGYREGKGYRVYDREDKDFYTINPVSGRTYRHDTDFTLFVNRGDTEASGGGLDVNITLKRVDTGKTITLDADPLIWF